MRKQGFSWERAHPKGRREPFWLKDNGAGSKGKGDSECGTVAVTQTPLQPTPILMPESQCEGLPSKAQIITRGISKLEFKALIFYS